MEEDIKILEEMCNEIIKKDDCNLFETLSPLEIALKLENLIKGYRNLETENIQLKKRIHIKKCQNCGEKFECKRSDTKYCKECGKKVNNSNYYENLTEEQKAKRREKARLSMQKIRKSRKLEEK